MTSSSAATSYRQDIFEDVLSLPSMREKLLELLNQIDYLKDYGTWRKSAEEKSGLWDLLHRLEDAISRLDNMPEKFRRYEREPWKRRDLRVFPVDNYPVFYIPDMERQFVTVIRVMYGGRDVDKELKRHTHYEE